MIGQSFQLERVWTQYYRSTGTFHALVISGTHVAILAAFFLFFLRVCFVPESVALLLTVVAAWFYALLTGWLAPCTRAAAGLTLVLIAGYFYRERRPLNLLAAVALGFLVFDPEQMFDASFQLTFLAVAFLGAFATPLIRATSGPLARGLQDLGDTRPRHPLRSARGPVPNRDAAARRDREPRGASPAARRHAGGRRRRPRCCCSSTKSRSSPPSFKPAWRCPWWSTSTASAYRASRPTLSWFR